MSDIRIEVKDRIQKITLNRADKKNALTRAMYDELCALLRDADEKNDIALTLITGSGGSFTSGNDLMDFMQEPPTSLDSPVGRFLHTLIAIDKPLVAAVNGPAVGIGATIIGHCDAAYATTSSWFQLPFVNLGLVPEAGATHWLAEMVGSAKAGDWLMTGRKITATEALESGLLSDVFDDDSFEESVIKRATMIASAAPDSIRVTKRLMRHRFRDAMKSVMSEEGEIFMKKLNGPEAQEAMGAFFEKRKPNFWK